MAAGALRRFTNVADAFRQQRHSIRGRLKAVAAIGNGTECVKSEGHEMPLSPLVVLRARQDAARGAIIETSI